MPYRQAFLVVDAQFFGGKPSSTIDQEYVIEALMFYAFDLCWPTLIASIVCYD